MSIMLGREGLDEMKKTYPDMDWSSYELMSDGELAEIEFDTEPSIIAVEEVAGSAVHLDKLLVEAHLCKSRTEAQRKIKESAVYVDEERATERIHFLTFAQMRAGVHLRLGKKAVKVMPPLS